MRLTRTPISLLLLFVIVNGSGVSAEVDERIAAVVNGEIIFLSNVLRFEKVFGEPRPPKGEITLSEENSHDGAAGELPFPPPAAPHERAALERLIDHRLLLAEARRFEVEPPSGKEVDGEVRVLKLGGGPTPEVRDLVKERLWVKKFVEERISLFVNVSPDDARAYFDANRETFGDQPFEAVREKIIGPLAQKKKEERLDDLVRRLRSRAQIRINL